MFLKEFFLSIQAYGFYLLDKTGDKTLDLQ